TKDALYQLSYPGSIRFPPNPALRGALFLSGACAPNWTAFEHRSCDCPAVFCNPTTRAWWTGKDSNLRSPQGAADLQSAGFSHSPTRPVKIFWDANYESRTCPSTTCGHPS